MTKSNIEKQQEETTTTESSVQEQSSNETVEFIKSIFQTGEDIDTGYIDEDVQGIGIGIGCPICSYTGYIQLENKKYEFCKCHLEDKFLQKMKKARIPKDYFDKKSIADIGVKMAKKAYSSDESKIRLVDSTMELNTLKSNVNKLLEDGWNMIIEGPTGTGKTTLACILIKEVLRLDEKALFLEFEDIKRFWTGEELPEVLEESRRNIYDVPCLVIDDLGKSKTTENFLNKFDHLIRTRLSEKRMTIFTTNLTKDNVENVFEERIFSLLQMRNIHYILHTEFDVRVADELPDFLREG